MIYKCLILHPDINIFIPDNAKLPPMFDTNENQDLFMKFSLEKPKEWNDIGIHELLGKYDFNINNLEN